MKKKHLTSYNIHLLLKQSIKWLYGPGYFSLEAGSKSLSHSISAFSAHMCEGFNCEIVRSLDRTSFCVIMVKLTFPGNKAFNE